MICTRFNQQAAPVMMPIISEDFMLSSAMVGLYSTFWSVTATLGAVVMGSLSDRFGVRKILLTVLPVYGIGIFIHGYSTTYNVILAGALVAGLGYSAIAPCLTKYIRTEAAVNQRGKFQGFVMAGLDFGALGGALVLPAVALALGWRSAFQLVALLIFLVTIPVYLHIRETRPQSAAAPGNTFRKDLTAVLTSRPFWRIALLGFLMGGVVASTLIHFSMYLYQSFSFNPVEAGWGFAFIFVGATFGRLLAGSVSDRFFPYRRHIALGLFSGLAGVACLNLALLTVFSSGSISVPVIWASAFVAGLGIFGENPIRFIMAGELVSGESSGIFIGSSLMVARLGFMTIPPLFGFLVDLTGSYAAGWALLALLTVGVIVRVVFWPRETAAA